MALYEMLKPDGSPYLGGSPGLYSARSGFGTFGEIISDEEARERGLIDADGFPAKGWIWHPGGEPSRKEERDAG